MTGETRLPGKVARSLITWAERNADPAAREWLQGMRAELDGIDGDLAQLRWAAGALPLLWRPYRGDFARFLFCIATVVVVNYSYPKFATARPVELLFFAQQFFLPIVGMFAARTTQRILAGTALGIAVSLIGFGVLFVLAFGGPDVTALLASGSPSVYRQILLFGVIGAAFGTLGATTIVSSARRALATT
jgi:hypothetical protein